MTTLVRPFLTVAALLALITYLMLQGMAPYLPEQEQRLHAVDAIVLNQAALERDALRIRAGLLANYDPLVDANAGLQHALQQLQTDLPDWPQVAERFAAMRQAVAQQEPLIDAIKTSNALVQNSLAYFTFLVSGQAAAHGGLGAELAGLATGMLRFSKGVGHVDADTLTRALDQYDRVVRDEPPGAWHSIGAHGRMILRHMAILDEKLVELGRSPVEASTVAFRALLVERYAALDREASTYQGLLYLTAILLLGYLSVLYLKLRLSAHDLGRHAQELEIRAAAQSMIAELSTSFIDIPPEQIGPGVRDGIALLGQRLGVDRAYLLFAADSGWEACCTTVWPAGHGNGDWPDPALSLLAAPELIRLEQDGCIPIASVSALPPGTARTALEAHGIRAWLGIPLWQKGQRVGLLGFDLTRGPRDWSADGLQHLRIASDIFAHALERQRAEMERAALAIRLAQAERMEAIGTLAGGIAHNFNNILGAILGYAEMAAQALTVGSQVHRHVEAVHTAGMRAKLLVDQILTFSRRGEGNRTPVGMARLIEETTGLLNVVLPATVKVEIDRLDANALVMGDPTQLQQIIMNLCTNAAQAMNGVGRISLAISVVETAGQRNLSHGTMPAGRYVRIGVSDEGHGIDQATLQRIFEPFFTTKPSRGGTGLGLATVHGIVADHGGAMNVLSRPGQGTVFEVYLPATAEADLPLLPVDPSRGDIPFGAGQVVLLVDDEEMLVSLTEEILAGLGYEPAGFTDPLRAVQAFEADPERFDLVLSDMVMPGMTGDQLADRITLLRPDVPVVLMTGYGDLVAPERPAGRDGHPVLRKPLSSIDLARELARRLPSGGMHPANVGLSR
ncbi:MAG TPA: two-component system VirA-like sensor kinase [Geminicoccus sp.]|uniref:two-component system VirA-like sensor kinase n=1 Tax=Geminicoccus sp. TaxID=2024832 RepID=UPI002B5B4AF1|nr:two-component system VirA-like sensor kinase [Geminicoccus sp.]HWL68405.1 two-component system VirA-like sensor kinase [Geminicoccus sp.]